MVWSARTLSCTACKTCSFIQPGIEAAVTQFTISVPSVISILGPVTKSWRQPSTRRCCCSIDRGASFKPLRLDRKESKSFNLLDAMRRAFPWEMRRAFTLATCSLNIGKWQQHRQKHLHTISCGIKLFNIAIDFAQTKDYNVERMTPYTDLNSEDPTPSHELNNDQNTRTRNKHVFSTPSFWRRLS